MMALLAQEAANDTYMIWGFLLLGVSLMLLCIELFVPSGGLIGLVAGVTAIGSLVSFWLYDETWGIFFTALYLILGPIGAVFGFKLWLNSPFARKMILGGRDENADDEGDGLTAAEIERRARLAELRDLIGAEGVTATALRPVGTVVIEGQRLDALAESGIIESGVRVVVCDVYDNQVKVRPS